MEAWLSIDSQKAVLSFDKLSHLFGLFQRTEEDGWCLNIKQFIPPKPVHDESTEDKGEGGQVKFGDWETCTSTRNALDY